jgi:hypothetical protein
MICGAAGCPTGDIDADETIRSTPGEVTDLLLDRIDRSRRDFTDPGDDPQWSVFTISQTASKRMRIGRTTHE